MTRKHIAWIGAGLIALAALACSGLGGASTLPVGETAPNFGINTNGRTVTLTSFRGRLVIVFFWSST